MREEEARVLYAQSDAAHDFDHVCRVTRLAVQIARAEGAEVTVVRLAALLHDLPVANDVDATHRLDHHLAAAAAARELLTVRGLDPMRVDAVVHAIAAHRFRDGTRPPQTLEARCLYDADKLDAMGAIGVGRVFAYAGAHGNRLWTAPWTALAPDARLSDAAIPTGADYTPVHEFVYKLQRLAATLHTATARALAAQRHEFMVAFFDRLDAEMQGDC